MVASTTMALIQCKECGRDVSDQANACPGCGFPLRRVETRTISLTSHGMESTRGLREYEDLLKDGWEIIEDWDGDSWVDGSGYECQERFYRFQRVVRPDVS